MAKIRNASAITPLMLQLYIRIACRSSARQRKERSLAAAFCVRAGQPLKGAVLFYALLFLLSIILNINSFILFAINKAIPELIAMVRIFEEVDIVFIFKPVTADINE